MGKPIDSRALAILKKYELDTKNDQGEYKALWDCHGTWVMYHRYIEQAGASNGIKYKFEEIETNSANGIVCVKCTAVLDKGNDKKVQVVLNYEWGKGTMRLLQFTCRMSKRRQLQILSRRNGSSYQSSTGQGSTLGRFEHEFRKR